MHLTMKAMLGLALTATTYQVALANDSTHGEAYVEEAGADASKAEFTPLAFGIGKFVKITGSHNNSGHYDESYSHGGPISYDYPAPSYPTYPTYPGNSYSYEAEAGPIWNNDHARGLCPQVCGYNGDYWTGQWRTVIWNELSICECVNY